MRKLIMAILAIVLIFISLFYIVIRYRANDSYQPDEPDTNLEFWITENVEDYDFTGYDEIYMWGGKSYFGKEYHYIKDGAGNLSDPPCYVRYTITAYPDYSDGGKYVTAIDITDPKIHVYGLTVESTLDEFDQTLKEIGYTIQDPDGSPGHKAKKKGITITLVQGHMSIEAEVGNREQIMF